MKVGIIGLGYVGLPLAVAFAESGADVIGVDADSRKVERLRRSESDIEDISSDRLRDVAATFTATTSARAPRRVRRAADLRADAAGEPARAGPQLHRRRRHGAVGRAARGPAGRARVDHLPGDHARAPAADPRGVRPGRRPGLQPRLLAGADRPRPHRPHDPDHARRSSAGSPTPAATAPSSSTSWSATRSSRSRPPRPPSWRSCSRTSSARSTSPSSTSSRCSATGWTSTSGR